ncbi:uncharacterized protein LOC130732142 [Lotus japonicus]|uniref:uncharacterized protein LOC130732142 n=1 Tax=Lotus japonicus TaxID=34305 RepID=UPI00258CB4AE|nr:uncharacterized protein LOC130732142 [Lotus japonicus]
MKKFKVVILFIWALFASCTQVDFKVVATASSPTKREIKAKLKLLNKPSVKTIKSEDGDIIDCVDIYKQSAFDHPALKDHKLQKIPDFLIESKNSSNLQTKSIVFQTWQKNGSCPEGTIPIRRIRTEDLSRAASLNLFGRKPIMHFMKSTNNTNSNYPIVNGSFAYVPENRTKAFLVTVGYSYIGAEAEINVWNPRVDLPDDFTTAQIWLKTGNGPQYFESIESGWQVNPKLYGDRSTRFFAHWTTDSYKSTGCFDVVCPGFVQVGQVVLGGAITPISYSYHTQKEIPVGMYWDNSGNWWLKVNNHIVGYWPAKLLSGLSRSAKSVEWGGQVYSPMLKKNTPHTRTAMGSGEAADGRWGNACYMRNLRIKDYSRNLKYPEYVSTRAEEPYCYNVINEAKYGQEPILYFGGPGFKPPYCP